MLSGWLSSSSNCYSWGDTRLLAQCAPVRFPHFMKISVNFRYVYADNRNVGMDQPPGTPSVSDFSPELASLFNAAFSSASACNRPSAERWVSALESLERNLSQCQDNPLHFGPRDASECAWCEMEKLNRTVLFLPYAPSAVRPGVFDPGSAGFNLGTSLAPDRTVTEYDSS